MSSPLPSSPQEETPWTQLEIGVLRTLANAEGAMSIGEIRRTVKARVSQIKEVVIGRLIRDELVYWLYDAPDENGTVTHFYLLRPEARDEAQHVLDRHPAPVLRAADALEL